MAIYLNNRLIKSGDFIRTTRQYSSPQSLNNAKKKRTQHVVAIGKMHFVGVMPDKVAALYGINSWDDLLLTENGAVPAGLSPMSKISKRIKMGETVILSWAVTNRIDVYWIAGHFFAHEHAVMPIAHAEQKRIASLTIPPKVRRKRTYLS